MHARDISLTLMIQAIEIADETGELISFEERRVADELLEGETVGSPSEGMLRRAISLAPRIERNTPILWSVSNQLQRVSTPVKLLVLLIGLILGSGTQSLSSGQYFHILSPTLIGLIVWNLLSMTLTLSMSRLSSQRTRNTGRSLLKEKTRLEGRGLSIYLAQVIHWWGKYKSRRRIEQAHNPSLTVQLSALEHYLDRWSALNAPLLVTEAKKLLHLSAITFAVGVIGSAYWDGLVRAFYATVESTFLSVNSIEYLTSFILWPSNTLLGAPPELIPMNPSELPPSLSKLSGTLVIGSAEPWIHRYSISILVWVFLPRVLLYSYESSKLKKMKTGMPAQLGWMETVPSINLALAAHTNVGKTSLARTLLRRDVGEVRDAEHVTRARSSYFLINDTKVRVRLWDTPGFGDLLSTQKQRNTFEHLMSEGRHSLPDLLRNQSLGLSDLDREALMALYQEADLVLYLVPAFPTDLEREQTRNEWSLLRALNLPTLIMINRIGEFQDIKGDPSAEDPRSISLKLWNQIIKETAAPDLFKGIYVLDAFERTQRDEQGWYELIRDALPPEQRILAQQALEVWRAQHQATLQRIAMVIYHALRNLASYRVSLGGQRKRDQKEAEAILQEKVSLTLQNTQEQLLDALGLQGTKRRNSKSFAMSVIADISKRDSRSKLGAIWGGLVSGVATGIGADLMTGGLSLGGGMLVGGILGAIGGFGAARGYSYLKDDRGDLGLEKEAIKTALNDLIFFAMVASVHGRARGTFTGPSNDLNELTEGASSLNHDLLQRCIVSLEQLNNKYGDELDVAITHLIQGSQEVRGEGQPLATSVKRMIEEGFDQL